MVKLARRVRMRAVAAGATALLAVGALAGCGGSGSHAHGSAPTSTAAGGSTTTATTTGGSGSLSVSPVSPTTRSEITFGFTARAASGVHGRHEISYSLSLVGPDTGGCVNAHEAGSPPVAAGAPGKITLGPAELQSPWCVGHYVARLFELSSAHCTGSAPCPQYVRVVGLVGRTTFRVRRG
jgi:hypothetical protein